jgi:hypothetical protein
VPAHCPVSRPALKTQPAMTASQPPTQYSHAAQRLFRYFRSQVKASCPHPEEWAGGSPIEKRVSSWGYCLLGLG